MRFCTGDDRFIRAVENSLFVVGEGRVALTQERRMLHLLEGLEQSDVLQEAEAYAEVVDVERRLRLVRARLTEIQERKATKQKIYAELRAFWASEERMLKDVEGEIAADASALGITYIRPELIPANNAAQGTPA